MNHPLQALQQQVTDLAQADPNIAVIWLYGSQAKGSEQADSDYDFAVAFNQFPTDEWLQRLQPENLQYDWQQRLNRDDVSVVDINHIPLFLANSVISHGRVVYCGDALRLAREELRISSMWELDYEWHQQHYG